MRLRFGPAARAGSLRRHFALTGSLRGTPGVGEWSSGGLLGPLGELRDPFFGANLRWKLS